MVHSAERLEMIETLKHMPVAVQEEIVGLPESVLRFKPAENEWSIKEVVGHLRDKAEVWGKRLYMVYSQTDPMFVLYDQDQAVRDKNYQEAEIGDVLAEWGRLQLQIVELLDRAVDWSRLGRHPEIGRRSLHQWVDVLLRAEKDHLEQIRGLKRAARAVPAG